MARYLPNDPDRFHSLTEEKIFSTINDESWITSVTNTAPVLTTESLQKAINDIWDNQREYYNQMQSMPRQEEGNKLTWEDCKLGHKYEVISGSCGSLSYIGGDQVVGTVIELIREVDESGYLSYRKVGETNNYKHQKGWAMGTTCSCCLKPEDLIPYQEPRTQFAYACVDDAVCAGDIIKPSLFKKMNNYFKKLTDKKVQALSKAGYINGDLRPTQKFWDAVNEIQFDAHYETIATMAQTELDEAEKEAKKN